MRVSDAMTREVRVCGPNESVRDCAAAMVHNDIGALPVAEVNALVGMVTDRDITVRAIAAGKGPDTPVREVLSDEVLYCFEDQELAQVAKSMGLAKIRRLPVLSRDMRLVGMLSLADIARLDAGTATAALADVSRRGGHHSQVG
jgi:CBS domain-containing protein